MSFVKDNGGPLVIGAAVLALVAGYMELRAPSLIDSDLNSRGFVSTDTLETIEAKIDSVQGSVDTIQEQHKTDADRLYDKVDGLVNILLEE